MEVRRLHPAEVDALRPAMAALAAHVDGLPTGMGPVRPEPELWERWRERYADAALFAAADQNGLAGCLVLVERPAWTSRHTTDPVLGVEALSVAPHARGRGVGRALLEAVRAHVRDHGPLDATLGVSTANAGALRFYAREGWRPFTSIWLRRVAGGATADGGRVDAVGADDVDRLAPLHRALCERHDLIGPAYLPRRRSAAELWDEERGRHLPAEDRVVLRAGDDGYVLANLRRVGFQLWDVGPVGHVDALVVRDGARGGGVGVALLRAAERELAALGARAIDLEVLEGNAGAQRFYAREGFARVLEVLHTRL